MSSHGSTRRGDEPPDWMRDKQARLARIRAARAELEAEARAAEAARPPAPSNPDGSPKPRPGRTPKHEPGKPKPKAQRNFTDPQSRIMKGRDGFIQAYNAQAAVDADGRSSWRIASPTMALIRTPCWHCSMQSRPIPARCRTKFPPRTAFVQKPISRASTRARFAAMWRPGAQASPGSGKKGGKLVQAMRADFAKVDIRADTVSENTQSNPCLDTSSRPRLPTIPPPRDRQGKKRMGNDLHCPQPRKTHRLRIGAANQSP